MADHNEFTKLLLDIASDILRSEGMVKDMTNNGSFVKDKCVYWYYREVCFIYINPQTQTILLIDDLSHGLEYGEQITELYAEMVAMDIINFFISAGSIKKLATQLARVLTFGRPQRFSLN